MEIPQSTFTDSQIIKLSDLWGISPSDLEKMVEDLEPMLRKSEARTILEFVTKFSRNHSIPTSTLSEFVKGLFTALRKKERENHPGLSDSCDCRGQQRGN